MIFKLVYYNDYYHELAKFFKKFMRNQFNLYFFRLDKVNLAESSQKNERVYLVKEKEELSKKLSTSENDINLLKSQLKAKELEFMQIESEQEKKSVRFQTIIKIINDFLKYFELETFNKEETLEYVDFLERNLKAIQNSFSIKIEDVKNLNNTVNIVKIKNKFLKHI